MTIEQYTELSVVSEYEQVLIVTSNLQQLFRGQLKQVPNELLARKLLTVSALGDSWTSKYHLDGSGWTGLFVEEEDFEVADDNVPTLGAS